MMTIGEIICQKWVKSLCFKGICSIISKHFGLNKYNNIVILYFIEFKFKLSGIQLKNIRTGR